MSIKMQTNNVTRRGVLKAMALFTAGIKGFNSKLVLDGEVITGAHWGILKFRYYKSISCCNA